MSSSSLFLKRRRVFLTGASRGIGHAIRQEFEAHNLEVICPTRDELDLASSDAIQKFVSQNMDLSADILINNAGINFPAPITDLKTEAWEQCLQVNLTAPFLLSRHFAQGMIKNGWGRILNVSSVFSMVTKEKRSVYSASKSALNGFTRTAAVEWGSHGVLVNAICPGYIDTDLTRQNNSPADIEKITQAIPLKRMATAQEIAKMAVFLCSDMNSYMTGQCVVVDGGFSSL